MTPLVDIVMLVHDNAGWADLAVRAVEQFTKNPYRLVIVDSASQEAETRARFAEWRARGHTVIHLAQNRSFSNGVNVGVNAGSSKFIVVLNDDALVTEGWDTAMLQDANEKGVGLVGARSNYAAGAQGGAKCFGDPPFLVFVCVCLRREVWNAVGPMDEETFDGFSSEDLDYSWRVVKGGLRLKLSSAFVLHAGSRTLTKTLSTGDAASTQLALAKNNQKYGLRLEEKWGKDWVREHSKLQQSVLVATYSPQETVYMDFAKACMALKQASGYEFTFYQHTRTPIHLARQLVCDYACNQGYDVLVQLDDDATFPPDLLPRLLGHNKEVVCALAYQRKPPYAAVAYELDADQLEKGRTMGNNMEGIEHTGLRKVDVSGFHVSAVRMSVIKKMRAFRSEKFPEGIKEYWGGFERVGEDFHFALNLRRIGVPLYIDTDLIAGHIASPHVIGEDYKGWFQQGKAR